MRDSAKPTMFQFDKAGNLAGGLDQNKRMGYGALAAMLGADSDRYEQDNRANMFQQDLQQQGELARLPYQQMTMADQGMSDFRDRELQQRSEISRLPYDRMTPYEEGSLDVERQRSQRGDPLVEAFAPALAGNPEVMDKVMSRIMGENYQPRPPEQLQAIMADQVNDNEVTRIVAEELGDEEKWTIGDYSKANQITAEAIWEQFEAGDRDFEAALAAAKRSDANPKNPKGAKSTVEALLRRKAAYDKAQQSIKETRRALNAPETRHGMEGIPYIRGAQW
jgi:hypothetical protein